MRDREKINDSLIPFFGPRSRGHRRRAAGRFLPRYNVLQSELEPSSTRVCDGCDDPYGSQWRWDEGEWQTCGPEREPLDLIEIRGWVTASWVHLGEIELAAGPHSLEVKGLPGARSLAFDCWLLTSNDFTPEGGLPWRERESGASTTLAPS